MLRFLVPFISAMVFIFGCAGTKPPSISSGAGPDELSRLLDRFHQGTDSIAKLHPLRLGVLPFIPSEPDAYDTSNEFGNYIAEKLTSRFSESGERIKLYERSRLDAICKENSIVLSGLVSEEQAVQVGELVPIDYLFTGTYTELRQRISLSGRLIDVASGEIVYAASGECTLAPELSALLPGAHRTAEPEGTAGTESTDTDRCAGLQQSLDDKVKAAKPDDQFAVLIREGMKVPFDTVCPSVHYGIIRRCRRDKVSPPDYSAFLFTVLGSIGSPDDDNRTDAIFNYFHADGVIDDHEWNAGCDALENVRRAEDYLGRLIIGDTLTAQLEDRLDDLVTRCRRGKIGKPAAAFDVLLYKVISRLGMFGRSSWGRRPPAGKELRQVRDVLHLVNKYSGGMKWTVPEKYGDLFVDLWWHTRYSPLSDSLFTLACEMVARTPSEKGESVILRTADHLTDDLFRRDTATALFHRSAVHAAEQFAEKCRERIIEVAEQLEPRRLSNTKLPAFCLFTGITAPAIPTADSISLWLSSEDANTSRRGADYAYYMGKRAIVLEDKLIRVLRQRIRHRKGSEYDNGRVIRALGVSRTAKPEACELLILCLDSLNYRFPSSDIVRALAAIGKPAVPYMKRHLEKDPASHAYAAADFFELLGPEAKRELPYLEKKARSISDNKAKYYLEDALDRMKQKLSTETKKQ